MMIEFKLMDGKMMSIGPDEIRSVFHSSVNQHHTNLSTKGHKPTRYFILDMPYDVVMAKIRYAEEKDTKGSLHTLVVSIAKTLTRSCITCSGKGYIVTDTGGSQEICPRCGMIFRALKDVGLTEECIDVDQLREEVKRTWAHARDADGQTEAFRILERMVDRIGYGRTKNNPSLAEDANALRTDHQS